MGRLKLLTFQSRELVKLIESFGSRKSSEAALFHKTLTKPPEFGFYSSMQKLIACDSPEQFSISLPWRGIWKSTRSEHRG